MKILAFAASLRVASFNRKLIGQAANILRSVPDVDVDLADFREFEMPMYDGDLELREGIPAGGLELIKRTQSADGVVVSTPEYNGSIPGTLKNAIDWASRAEPTPLEGKPILLIGASPGGLGAVRSLWHTRVPFEVIGAHVYPEMMGVPRAHQAFDDNGNLGDPNQFSRLQGLLFSYIDFVRKLRGPS